MRPAKILLIPAALLHTAAAMANSGPAQSALFARADSAITAAANPAGMTRLDNPEWVGQALIFVSESTFEQSADSVSGSVVDENDGSLLAPLIYYAHPLNDKWAVGGSVTAMAFGEDIGDTGPTRYLVDEWSLVMASLSPAVAYRVNPRLSLGGAININYTLYSYESAVFNPEPDIGDGRMEIEDDDISLAFQLSILYEFSPHSRIGLNYRSENESEFSDTPSFSNLGPTRETLLEQGSVLGNDVSFSTTMPQMVGAGVYHEFQNGTSVTADVLWMEFSAFGMSEFGLGSGSIETSTQNFEDAWAFSAGIAYPLNNRWTIKAGAMFTSQFIDDVNRTQTFKMDDIRGIGVGAEYHWGDDKIIGLNVNYYDMGDAPVEKDIPLIGIVKGEFTENHAIGFDLTFRWIR